MDEKNITLRSRVWNSYFNWSERHGRLAEFVTIYVSISLSQVPIYIVAPGISFLLTLAIVLPPAFVMLHYRQKYIRLEMNKRFLTEMADLQEKIKQSEKLKKTKVDEESLKIEEGKVCVAVCRGCNVRIYTGDELHKGKENYCFCGKCKPTI